MVRNVTIQGSKSEAASLNLKVLGKFWAQVDEL